MWTLILTSPNPDPLNSVTINRRSLCNLSKFPKLSYSLQNCNSLNISTVCDKQLKKIVAITSLETDIILPCDIRLGMDTEQIERISKLFRYNKNKPYEFVYNSSLSRRGVGILVSVSLSATIQHVLKDEEQNILGVTLNIANSPIWIFSVYGPNSNDRNFFNTLSDFLLADPTTPCVIGGDWNATYCSIDGNDNIDTYRMNHPPSIIRSGWLN